MHLSDHKFWFVAIEKPKTSDGTPKTGPFNVFCFSVVNARQSAIIILHGAARKVPRVEPSWMLFGPERGGFNPIL
jgi:hypothetical protein